MELAIQLTRPAPPAHLCVLGALCGEAFPPAVLAPSTVAISTRSALVFDNEMPKILPPDTPAKRACKSFRINTCGTVTKQITLSRLESTLTQKQGGGSPDCDSTIHFPATLGRASGLQFPFFKSPLLFSIFVPRSQLPTFVYTVPVHSGAQP
jgi:hypothetical protein